jgi:inosose dehydratase
MGPGLKLHFARKYGHFGNDHVTEGFPVTTSRRQFLTGLAASGAVASLPSIALASLRAKPLLYPPVDLSYFEKPIYHGDAEIRIGYAAITWNGKDAQAIEEISALGYPGIQLRANILKEFPDPHRVRDLLGEHNLAFVALSSGGAPMDPAKRQQAIDTHVKNAQYLRQAGGKYLQVIGASSKNQIFSSTDYKYEGELLTEIAKHVADYGIQTGFHNHMGTIGQAPERVDAILDAADPKYVKLELDVAHYVQGGGNPAAAIRKYGPRVLFLHVKDTKPTSAPGGYEFVELGEGRVDFPVIFEALRSIHFRGWGIVELDRERAELSRTAKESAQISKDYLEQKVGVRI